MRIRSLKPGFFKNEQLCELSPWHRLCFEGLWLCADREGRLEDRPRRLKAEIFPYDDLDMNSLLWDLMHAGFIVRYSAPNLQPLIWIPSWSSHQFPRSDEAASKLPAYIAGMERRNGTHETTFPSTRPDDRAEPTLIPALTAIDTDPSLSSDCADAGQQIGDGILDLGDGRLEMGNGNSAADAARPSFRAQDLMDLWNAVTKPPIPRCRELTDDRRRKIRARIAKRPSLTEWREAFEAIQARPFYRGQNDRGWTADFDWAIRNDTTIAKVLERVRTVEPPMIGKQTSRLMQAVANIQREARE